MEPVRAHKMADIFDSYFDIDIKVFGIKSGYGKIRPKLYITQRRRKTRRNDTRKGPEVKQCVILIG